MNKVAKGFLNFTAWVWLLVSALGLLFIGWKPDYVRMVFDDYAKTVILSCAGVGGLLLLVWFYILWNKMFSLKKRKEVHYANAIGEIAISLHAIEEALGRLLDDYELVRAHEIQIFDSPNDKKLKVTAKLSMWEVSDLPSKVADLQQELKKRFEEIMPDAESVEYNVKLSSFMPRKERASRESEHEEEEKLPARQDGTDETDYFTGLKYPIETDDDEDE